MSTAYSNSQSDRILDGLSVETFVAAQALKPSNGERIIVRERANAYYITHETGYSAITGDVTFANGSVGELQIDNDYLPEFFGAVGDKSTDDTVAVQAAIDAAAANGGGLVRLNKKYRTTATTTLNGAGVRLQGTFPKNIFSTTVPSSTSGVLYADFTSGPAVLITDGGCAITELTIEGSATRRAAAITTGVRNSNSGIQVEGVDDGTDIIQNVEVRDVFCIHHPADGFLSEGNISNLVIRNFYSSDTGRHGLAITDGSISGRVNKAQPGIIVIEKGKSFDCGGHGLCIGHPNSSSYPYRVIITNREGYRLALDAGERYSTAGNFVLSQNCVIINNAFGGTTTGNTPDHAALEVGGRDIQIISCRYIGCAGPSYVIIRQQAGFSTEGISFIGGKCSTSGTPPADFAVIPSGPDGIEIRNIDFDGANAVDTISVGPTNNDVVLHDLTSNKTVYYNHTQDFTNSTVAGLTADGLTDTNILSDEVTVTKGGYYKLDTEADAATDTLTTITGGANGNVIILSQANSGRVITLDHGGGNIRLSGATNYVFPSANSFIQLMLMDGDWRQVAPAVDNDA